MASGVHLRLSAEDDERQLAELDAASWPLQLQVAPPQDASQAFFTTWRPARDVLVAGLNGSIAGYVRLGRHMGIPSNDHVLNIDALVVSPDSRGQGIGAALIVAAIAEARRRSVAKLGLRALSNNPNAIHLYERHGFTEKARLRAELRRPDGSYADDVWMSLWLSDLP
jgi:ribosomal protein S18 acetylase RimI-like enzyme